MSRNPMEIWGNKPTMRWILFRSPLTLPVNHRQAKVRLCVSDRFAPTDSSVCDQLVHNSVVYLVTFLSRKMSQLTQNKPKLLNVCIFF